MKKILLPVELKNVSYERNKFKFQKIFKNFYPILFFPSLVDVLISLFIAPSTPTLNSPSPLFLN
ncbi:hypothetical protein [Pedobacter cryophilus]|uniref:Uncharacterized protein n=1 Tax=Pedobacter cryophilus TaxID=2571271 RepID=A0A4V5NZY6_9SPHI|nr:hypothetical protein [Pedobacter cryophilus]TKB95139.1 hypothetical protein FA046_16930 [Pedobacter cryophilus]